MSLKDSVVIAEFTSEFTSVATREVIDRDMLRCRLLLCLVALGTNTGIIPVAARGRTAAGSCSGRPLVYGPADQRPTGSRTSTIVVRPGLMSRSRIRIRASCVPIPVCRWSRSFS